MPSKRCTRAPKEGGNRVAALARMHTAFATLETLVESSLSGFVTGAGRSDRPPYYKFALSAERRSLLLKAHVLLGSSVISLQLLGLSESEEGQCWRAP